MKRILVYLVIILAVLALVFFAARHFWPPTAPPAYVRQDRALVDTLVAYKTRVDTVTVRVDHFITSVRESAAAGRTEAARLDSEATATVDTAPRSAYVKERARGDTLQHLGLTLTMALDTMTVDRDRWKTFASDSLVPALVHVQADLERATKPCRILWSVPCPSRVQMAILGMVGGALLVTHPPNVRRFPNRIRL